MAPGGLTDIEMLSLAHLLQTPVHSYSHQHGQWQRYSPHDVDRQLVDDLQQRSMYLYHTGNHFNVVGSIRRRQLHEPLSTFGEEDGGSILFEVASPVHIL